MPIDTVAWRRFQRLRWTSYGILVLAYMTVYFHRMAPGVVSAELMASFHTSGAALGSLAATYYYIYTAMQIPAGVLADTLGPRLGVGLGCLVAGAGSLLFGGAESFEAASLGRFLVGLGVSVVFVGLMRSNTQWFSERNYGAISGFTLLLGNLGSILAAGPLALALKVVSWRDIFIWIGILSLMIALLTLIFVRSQPRDAGLPSLRELEGLDPHPPRDRHWLLDLRGVLTTAAVWPSFFMMFGVAGSLFAFAGLWGVPLMRDGFGLDRTQASLYTTMALAGFAIGCLTMGVLSDRLGRRKPLIRRGQRPVRAALDRPERLTVGAGLERSHALRAARSRRRGLRRRLCRRQGCRASRCRRHGHRAGQHGTLSGRGHSATGVWLGDGLELGRHAHQWSASLCPDRLPQRPVALVRLRLPGPGRRLLRAGNALPEHHPPASRPWGRHPASSRMLSPISSPAAVR